MSDDAGGFVCNHAFYTALAEADRRRLPTRCGFLHLPRIEERQAAPGSTAAPTGMSADDLVRAVRLCVHVAGSVQEFDQEFTRVINPRAARGIGTDV